jgi:hypothetical protein
MLVRAAECFHFPTLGDGATFRATQAGLAQLVEHELPKRSSDTLTAEKSCNGSPGVSACDPNPPSSALPWLKELSKVGRASKPLDLAALGSADAYVRAVIALNAPGGSA